MASSKARRRNRLSILDMSMEDDSLLPLHVCTTVNEEDEDQQEHQETQEQAAEVYKPPTPPPPPRRTKKSGHANLRKSLAWDKAFLTGEGVLEPDELPIAAKSLKKLPELPELPTLDINSKPANVPEENESGPELTSRRSYSERFDYRLAGMENLQLEPSSVKDSAVSGPTVPRILPSKKVIESAIQKGTRLRLPSAVTAEQRAIPLPAKQPKESNLSKKVTLVSRRMKDSLGRVLPGRVDSLEIKGETPNVDSSSSWDTCSVSDVRESISDVSSKKEEHCFQRSYSTGSRLKTEEMRSGLRVPSPKLGFFDSRKALQPSQSVRSSFVSSGAQHPPVKAVRVRPQGLPKAKPRQVPATALPTPNPCNSAPTTPRKSANELLSPSARLAVSTNTLTPNSKASSRRLGMDAVAEQDKESKSPRGVPVDPALDASSKTSLLPRFPKLRLGRLGPETETQPLAVNSGLLNSGSNAFKEKGSFFAFARKAVGRLSSPSHEKENGGHSEEIKTAAAVKTGPVQHSPPNKSAPQIGPWSPVKKHGTTQLGPFDCTKSNAQAVEWGAV